MQSWRADHSAIKQRRQLARLKQKTRMIKDHGYHHANRQCPAYGQTCLKCEQKNHFQSKCQSTTPHVNTVEEVTEEVFNISQAGSSSRALITMEAGKQRSQSQVTFQLDTGAESNLLSLKDYRSVTRDMDLKQVNRRSHKDLNKWAVQDNGGFNGVDKTPHMVKEMCCFSTLQKMTSHHCYQWCETSVL